MTVLEHAGSILQRTCGGGIRLSRQKLCQAEAIEIVRLKREQGAQTLAFISRPFVMCGLPVRRLPADELLYDATAVSCLRSLVYSRPRRFRGMLEQLLRTIRAIWPECPARIDGNGEQLIVPHAEAVGQPPQRTCA